MNPYEPAGLRAAIAEMILERRRLALHHLERSHRAENEKVVHAAGCVRLLDEGIEHLTRALRNLKGLG